MKKGKIDVGIHQSYVEYSCEEKFFHQANKENKIAILNISSD